MTSTTQTDLLDAAADRARDAGVFAEVRRQGPMLVCGASGAAAEAEYRLTWEGRELWVSLVTPDRWLSESIETDLVHTGDKLEELLEDELVDLGYEGPALTFEHFRSEDLLFTFRSRVREAEGGGPAGAEVAALCLLAYEQCFRQLGDMEESEED